MIFEKLMVTIMIVIIINIIITIIIRVTKTLSIITDYENAQQCMS
jgi:cell division protein FtsL